MIEQNELPFVFSLYSSETNAQLFAIIQFILLIIESLEYDFVLS